VKALYTAVATASDRGRNGRARSDEGKLVVKAHERCPYSNATRGNIDVELVVSGGAPVTA
jgi:organic hydroperoxide reductase OsmC/OhrA